jgi:hypothetical protein
MSGAKPAAAAEKPSSVPAKPQAKKSAPPPKMNSVPSAPVQAADAAKTTSVYVHIMVALALIGKQRWEKRCDLRGVEIPTEQSCGHAVLLVASSGNASAA